MTDKADSITGRDTHIIAQALYTFIRVQQSLPDGGHKAPATSRQLEFGFLVRSELASVLERISI